MWSWTWSKTIYWGGILGSVAVGVYAVFVWQFPWYMYLTGTTYLDVPPIQILKSTDSPTHRGGQVHPIKMDTIFAPSNHMVAQNQALFSVKVDVSPDVAALHTFYDINQDILFDALLYDKMPLFLHPKTIYEQRIIAYYEGAYIKNIWKIQQYVDTVAETHVAYLKDTAHVTRQKVFDTLIMQPVFKTRVVRAPINGVIIYQTACQTACQTLWHIADGHMVSASAAFIFPIDAPVAVKIYVPADMLFDTFFDRLGGDDSNRHIPIYYGGNVRMRGVVSDIIKNDTNADGEVAVVIHVLDSHIYAKNMFISPDTPMQVAIPYGKGSIYAFIKNFLTVTF